MAGRPKGRTDYSVEQMAEALKDKRGLITLAAEQIGCTPETLRNRVHKTKSLQEIVESFRERRVDTAELALDKAIMNGEAWAIALVLKTLGKNRGYVERQEVTGGNGGPLEIKAYDYSTAIAAIKAGPVEDSE